MPDPVHIAAYAIVALGRFLLGGYFIASGLRQFAQRVPITAGMHRRGIPSGLGLLTAASLFQVTGGTALALGIAVTPVALTLAAFTAAATAVMQNFWELDGDERELATARFLGNIAVTGGLVLAAATPLVRLG